MNHATSSTTDEHRANVATLRISHRFKAPVQSSFELRPVGGSPQRGDVARSSSIHASHDSFQRVERLAISSAHEPLTEEQRLLDGHRVQCCAVLLAFADVASTCDLRNRSSSLGDCPGIPEDLSVVHVASSNDADGRRPNRPLLISIAHSAPQIAAVDSSCGHRTDGTNHGQAGCRGSGSHQDDFVGALVQEQITRHDVDVRRHRQRGVTNQSSRAHRGRREDHRLGKVAMLDVAGRFVLQKRREAKQWSGTIRHEPSDRLCKTDRIQVCRGSCGRNQADSHFSSFSRMYALREV